MEWVLKPDQTSNILEYEHKLMGTAQNIVKGKGKDSMKHNRRQGLEKKNKINSF